MDAIFDKLENLFEVFIMSSHTKAYKNQFYFALTDGFVSLILGITLGYTSSSIVSMNNDPNFEIDDEQGNWVGSIIPGMALIGSLSANYFLEKIGRKKTMMISAIFSALAWVMVSISSNIYQVLFARLFAGTFCGILQVAVSIFMAETVDPKLRPSFGILPNLGGMGGFLLANIPATIMSWRILALLGSILCLPLLILLFSLSESPYYLMKIGKEKKAYETLLQLKETKEDADAELEALIQKTKENSKGRIHSNKLFSPPYRWPVVIAILLHVFQSLTGFITVSTFMGLIFERAKSKVDSGIGSLLMCVINTGSVLSTSHFPSKYGRRALLKYSSLILIVAHIIFSCYMRMLELEGTTLNSLAKNLTLIPLLSFLMMGMAFAIGWGPIPWQFIGDGIPVEIRTDTTSLIVATNWGFNFIISKTFSIGSLYFGYSGLFAFYAFFSFIGLVIMNKNLPETFGLKSTEIDNYYLSAYGMKKKSD